MIVHVPVVHEADTSSLKMEYSDVVRLLSDAQAETTGLVSAGDIILDNGSPWTAGEMGFGLMGDDCLVGVRNMQVKRDLTTKISIQNCLSLEFILDDSSDLQFGDENLPNNAMPRVYISSHHSNSQMTYFHKSGDKNRSITLIIQPDYLIKDFGLEAKQIDKQLQSILFLQSNATATLPLPCKLRSILKEVLEMPFSGVLAAQYLNAKIAELVCYLVQSLNTKEHSVLLNNNLPKHKSKAINKTLQCINEDLSNAPNINELGMLVGMSRNTLSSTFKTYYGMTVSEYILGTKMQSAREMLIDGKHSVLEVSQAVGYDTQSSFSRAYKRFFNCSPKNDRPNY